MYKENCYDFVGCMTGVVDKNELITGQNIELGDIILGIPSSGPHTNGYSLIRKIVEENPDKFSKELLEECCEPHRC